MDRLTAFVAINQLRLRLDILQKYPHLLGNDFMATPKLQGLAEAMKKLEHGLEDGAGKLLAKIETVGARGHAAIAKGHEKIDGKAAMVAEIETFVTALEGANGGDPLDDSSTKSDQSPEQLTVNGVSKT
jgi:hypothetical protein